MKYRLAILVLACAAMFGAGYALSVLRGAAPELASIREALAAAGDDAEFALAGASGDDPGGDYTMSALGVFSNVILHVKDNYVDPERIRPKEMLVAALREVERQVAEVLVRELGDGRVRVRVMEHEKIVSTNEVESLWEVNLALREVFRFFEEHLPRQKDPRAIEYAAVNGALSTLDPHSILLKPDAFAEMKTSTKGEFGGLGIVISIRDGKLTIISPLEGTPAWRAGLKTGDEITRIGDVSTVSMPIEEAVRMLRGPEGSQVTVWIARKDWSAPRNFTLTRELIKIESVESHLLSDNVGYIRIKNFQANTGKDLDELMAKLEKTAGRKLSGLVLDLRNNPGGLLEQAIEVSDAFLSSGDIVTTVGYGNKLREPKRARAAGTKAEIPVAVLVNEGSASASEIVAGALENLDRAVLIGERTFGKGSVQVLYDFADNSALKLTIAQYLTPGGISIQSEGVTPDIHLRPLVVERDIVRMFYEPEGHREQSLSRHLDKHGDQPTPTRKPAVELSYVTEKEKEEDEKEKPAEIDKWSEDYPIRFAREFLRAAGDASRTKMMAKAAEFLSARAKDEEARVAERMKKLGVDWSAASSDPLNGMPKATVDFELVTTNGGQIVEAGSEISLKAVIANAGNAPLYRVRGIVESEHPAFRGREFLFGRIEPGQSKEWIVSTKIPKEAASRSDLLKLVLHADGSAAIPSAELPIVTKHVPRPQFAYSYAIDDAKRGDGDGVLEAGEGVDLVALVTNTGAGGADDVSLRLESAAGEDLFLERGRVTLGKLAAGETRAARFSFHVRKNQTPGKENLPLEITMYDGGTGEWLTDEFALVAAPPHADKVVDQKGTVQTTTRALVFAAANGTAPVIATIAEGSHLQSTGKSGDFVRVMLGEDAPGWMRSVDVKRAAKMKKPTADLTFRAARRPPTIDIEGDLAGRVVDAEKIVLSGVVSARALRDMYVLANDTKVFFGSGASAKSTTGTTVQAIGSWAPPAEKAAVLPFSVELDLAAGLNKILVVARSDEKLVAYRNIIVSRRGLPAVAKANRPAKGETTAAPAN